MAGIDITRTVPYSADVAWLRLTDFTNHGAFVPLTTVRVLDPAAPGGGGFVARTAIGRLGFDDVNVLEVWQPPADGAFGLCQLRKAGRLVHGWARLSVAGSPQTSGADDSDGSAARQPETVVRWQENISVTGVPSICAPAIELIGARLFGSLLDGLMRSS